MYTQIKRRCNYFQLYAGQRCSIRVVLVADSQTFSISFLPNIGSKVGKFTKIDVSGCDLTKPTCILKRGSNATISIDFNLGKCINSASHRIHEN